MPSTAHSTTKTNARTHTAPTGNEPQTADAEASGHHHHSIRNARRESQSVTGIAPQQTCAMQRRILGANQHGQGDRQPKGHRSHAHLPTTRLRMKSCLGNDWTVRTVPEGPATQPRPPSASRRNTRRLVGQRPSHVPHTSALIDHRKVHTRADDFAQRHTLIIDRTTQRSRQTPQQEQQRQPKHLRRRHHRKPPNRL